MRELVFLLEEPSARAMLEGLLPRVVPSDVAVRYIVCEGKQDLEKQLARKIRGYLNPEARFVVLRDQDSHPDCCGLKARLQVLCDASGRAGQVLVRIACRELESFYLADLAAVEQGLGLSGLVRQQGGRLCKRPDQLVSPAQELKRLTKGRYQKVLGSRDIGPHLDPDNDRSRSFHWLVQGVRRLTVGWGGNGEESDFEHG